MITVSRASDKSCSGKLQASASSGYGIGKISALHGHISETVSIITESRIYGRSISTKVDDFEASLYSYSIEIRSQ